MRVFAIVLGCGLLGCGKSECQAYAEVFCDKIAACYGGITGGASRAECAEEGLKGIEAAELSEDECSDAKRAFARMSCSEFRSVVDSLSR